MFLLLPWLGALSSSSLLTSNPEQQQQHAQGDQGCGAELMPAGCFDLPGASPQRDLGLGFVAAAALAGVCWAGADLLPTRAAS